MSSSISIIVARFAQGDTEILHTQGSDELILNVLHGTREHINHRTMAPVIVMARFRAQNLLKSHDACSMIIHAANAGIKAMQTQDHQELAYWNCIKRAVTEAAWIEFRKTQCAANN